MQSCQICERSVRTNTNARTCAVIVCASTLPPSCDFIGRDRHPNTSTNLPKTGACQVYAQVYNLDNIVTEFFSVCLSTPACSRTLFKAETMLRNLANVTRRSKNVRETGGKMETRFRNSDNENYQSRHISGSGKKSKCGLEAWGMQPVNLIILVTLVKNGNTACKGWGM